MTANQKINVLQGGK